MKLCVITFVVVLLVGSISNRVFSQSDDSIWIKIPYTDTATVLFSQFRLPIALIYKDTSKITFEALRYSIEVRSVGGNWIDIKCPYQINDDNQLPIGAFSKNIEINLLYFFFTDSVSFNLCKETGCNIEIRFSQLFQLGSSMPAWKTSNTCVMSLPPAKSFEIDQFSFLRTTFPEELDAIPWLRYVNPQSVGSFESILSSFNQSVIKDVMRYHVMKKRHAELFELNGRQIDDNMRNTLTMEFGDLLSSESIIVSRSTEYFFLLLNVKN